MKERLLKAISKGLFEVLSIDIPVQNIDFDHAAVDNEYICEISLAELYRIFRKNNDDIFIKRYNTTNSMSLILDNGQEISLYEYNECMKPVFLKISNDELRESGNEILIYINQNHCIRNERAWKKGDHQLQSDMYMVDGRHYAEALDGYDTCKRIMDNYHWAKIGSIVHCQDQKKYGYVGYLPSIGQMKIVADYIHMINYIFSVIGCNLIQMTSSCGWWTCSEYSAEGIWLIVGRKPVIYNCNDEKEYMSYVNEYKVLPVFKMKKKMKPVMKEKILKAIDKGLMNVLSTDIADQNIDFDHDNVDNTCVLPYEYRTVDMGTGILWCEYNLGAYPSDNVSDWYGNYYAWGEIEIKDNYSWKNYKHCDGTKDTMTKYNRFDNLRTLTLENDVVNKVLGSSFRMPTQEEFKKLADSTTNEYVKNYNGIRMLNGILFTAENGNTLFFPAAGYCKETMQYAAEKTGGVWSSTLDYYNFNNSFNLGVYTNGAYLEGSTYRSYGLPVRGIKI